MLLGRTQEPLAHVARPRAAASVHQGVAARYSVEPTAPRRITDMARPTRSPTVGLVVAFIVANIGIGLLTGAEGSPSASKVDQVRMQQPHDSQRQISLWG